MASMRAVSQRRVGAAAAELPLEVLHSLGRDGRLTTRSAASVSVPVLSGHITDTEASDSIAFSCGGCRGGPSIAATASASQTSRINPSGTMPTIPAVASPPPSSTGVARCQANSPARASRTTSATSEIRRRLTACSSGERGWRNERASPAAPGVAAGADRGHLVGPRTLDRERAGSELIAGGREAPTRTRRSGSTRRAADRPRP